MMSSMPSSCNCPKCGVLLHCSGELTIGGDVVVPVFQCDDCVHTVELFGKPQEVAYTFALNASGEPIDPIDAQNN